MKPAQVKAEQNARLFVGLSEAQQTKLLSKIILQAGEDARLLDVSARLVTVLRERGIWPPR